MDSLKAKTAPDGSKQLDPDLVNYFEKTHKNGKAICCFCLDPSKGSCSKKHSVRIEETESLLNLPNLHDQRDEKSKNCLICKKKFSHYGILAFHYTKNEHLVAAGLKNWSMNDNYGKCSICRIMFTDCRDYKQHCISYNHYCNRNLFEKARKLVKKVVPDVKIDESVNEKLEKLRNEEIIHKLLCRFCWKLISGNEKECNDHLLNHLQQDKNNSNDSQLTCHVCAKTFSNLKAVKKHETNSSHKCKVVEAKLEESEETMLQFLKENGVVECEELGFKCTFCCVKLEKNNIALHISGKRHLTKMKMNEEKEDGDKDEGEENEDDDDDEEKENSDDDELEKENSDDDEGKEKGKGDNEEEDKVIDEGQNKSEYKIPSLSFARKVDLKKVSEKCYYCVLYPNIICSEKHVDHRDRLEFNESLLNLPDMKKESNNDVSEDEKLQLCIVCDVEFENYQDAIDHYVTQNHLNKSGINQDDLFVKCVICDREFKNKSQGRSHFSSFEHVKNSIWQAKVQQLAAKVDPGKASDVLEETVEESRPTEGRKRPRKRKSGRKNRQGSKFADNGVDKQPEPEIKKEENQLSKKMKLK